MKLLFLAQSNPATAGVDYIGSALDSLGYEISANAGLIIACAVVWAGVNLAYRVLDTTAGGPAFDESKAGDDWEGGVPDFSSEPHWAESYESDWERNPEWDDSSSPRREYDDGDAPDPMDDDYRPNGPSRF